MEMSQAVCPLCNRMCLLYHKKHGEPCFTRHSDPQTKKPCPQGDFPSGKREPRRKPYLYLDSEANEFIRVTSLNAFMAQNTSVCSGHKSVVDLDMLEKRRYVRERDPLWEVTALKSRRR